MSQTHSLAPFPWTSLPPELHLLILTSLSSQKPRGWSTCAAVCSSWRAILEPQNFHTLSLRATCLPDLSSLISVRTRPLIRHITLTIELPRYGCPTCQRNATLPTRNATIFRKAVLKLFKVLSTWAPTGRSLVLELNASSPSDSEHYFKNYCFGRGHEDPGDWSLEEKAIRWHDPKHGWVDGQQVRAPGADAIRRLFAPLCLNVPRDIPVVNVVTGFCIRRQLRRQLLPEVLQAILEKLPRLESVVYEFWRLRRVHCQIACAFELATLIETTLPTHLKHISIFKDFNHHLTTALKSATPYFGPEPATSPAVDAALAKAFAAKGHDSNWERLSISYMIDAQQFFTACQSQQQLSYSSWKNLQSLTLTASTLARMAPRQHVYALLRDAALTALKMPQLKSMVLWNSEPGHACAVLYRRDAANGTATLTWRGSWDLDLELSRGQSVVEAWKRVTSCLLRVQKEALRDVDIRSHGDAIYHLRLPEGVVETESLRQIRQEGRMQRMA